MAKQYKMMKVSPQFEQFAESIRFELQMKNRKKRVSFFDATNEIVNKFHCQTIKKIRL